MDQLVVFNGKSFAEVQSLPGPKGDIGSAGLLTFGAGGRKLVYYGAPQTKGLYFVPLQLTDEQRAQLDAAARKP